MSVSYVPLFRITGIRACRDLAKSRGYEIYIQYSENFALGLFSQTSRRAKVVFLGIGLY